MLNLNLKLQSSVTKGQVKTIDLELRKLDAMQASERIAILQVSNSALTRATLELIRNLPLCSPIYYLPTSRTIATPSTPSCSLKGWLTRRILSVWSLSKLTA